MLPQTQKIETLTAEILILKAQTAQNIIEIGKRLTQVKESLPHGEWGKWLKEKVDFSPETARRFIRVASECSKQSALTDLPQSKVFVLLSLPEPEREEFIQSNPVDEMTTRELQAAIKAQKEAEQKATEANNKVNVLLSEITDLKAKQPEPEIIEKEVIPESVKAETERLIREADKLQAENRTLKLQAEAAGHLQKKVADLQFQVDSAKTPIDNTMDLTAKVDRFAWRINQFLGEMGALAYVGGQYMRASDYSQREYEKALSSLEKWIQEVREAMQGSRYYADEKTEVIEVEQ